MVSKGYNQWGNNNNDAENKLMNKMRSNNLLEDSHGTIYSRAINTHKNLGNSVPFEDCLQEGYVIFCETIKQYDPHRGYKFNTYLYMKLKSLEAQVRIRNGLNRSVPTEEYNEEVHAEAARIDHTGLSDKAREVVSLILTNAIESEYGEGVGKRMPGRIRIRNFLVQKKKMSRKEVAAIFTEIEEWWKVESYK